MTGSAYQRTSLCLRRRNHLTLPGRTPVHVNFGLTISIKKTQVMGLNISSPPTLYLNSQLLEAVDVFPYLGSMIAANSSLDPEIKHRISKAASKMARLSKRVWENKKLTTATQHKRPALKPFTWPASEESFE